MSDATLVGWQARSRPKHEGELLPITDTSTAPPAGIIVPPIKGPSPFTKAATRPKRPKILVHGESGDGKTTFALRFPKPVVLDLEGGTDLSGCEEYTAVGVHELAAESTALLIERFDAALAKKNPTRKES
jgi:AAA domain